MSAVIAVSAALVLDEQMRPPASSTHAFLTGEGHYQHAQPQAQYEARYEAWYQFEGNGSCGGDDED